MVRPIVPSDTVKATRPPSHGRRARGTIESNRHHPKISITFDSGLFDQINDHAQAGHLTFGEAVRSLCSYAFEKLESEDGEAA